MGSRDTCFASQGEAIRNAIRLKHMTKLLFMPVSGMSEHRYSVQLKMSEQERLVCLLVACRHSDDDDEDASFNGFCSTCTIKRHTVQVEFCRINPVVLVLLALILLCVNGLLAPVRGGHF